MGNIYIITREFVGDLGNSRTTKAFRYKEDAVEYFERTADEMMHDNYGVYDVCDTSALSISCYNEGYYNTNHDDLTFEEVELC